MAHILTLNRKAVGFASGILRLFHYLIHLQKGVNSYGKQSVWIMEDSAAKTRQTAADRRSSVLNASDKERNTARKRQTAELKKAEKRKAEVDTLFAKMYEDWSAGRITEYNFNMLSEKYQGEQRELDAKIERLHEAMEAAAQTAVDAEKWIGLMKQYVNPIELTAELLNTLIEKILVHEAVKSEDGSREQEVEIFYRFIGKIE